MARRYPDEFVQQLKSQADIVQVISQFVKLEKMGNSYFGVCPFHADTDASFQVKPGKQLFGCFGCGAGTPNHSHIQSCDVFAFLKATGMHFSDAVEWLARMQGVSLPAMNPEEERKIGAFQSWTNWCEQACARFENNLAKNEKIQLYLTHRGIHALEIKKWRLGFGDKVDPDFVHTNARITFPLYDYEGRMVSFTGRVPFGKEKLAEENEKRKNQGQRPLVKYLDRWEVTPERDPHFVHHPMQWNSRNHPMPRFNKADYLFGIHIAKSYIQQWRSAVLLEGWTDVISMHKHGVCNAVSSMGTALTENQVILLKRAGARDVIIMRDGDLAGIQATERDSKLLERHNMRLFVVPLYDGQDPDDLCQRFHPQSQEVNKYIQDHMMSINQWRIYRIYDENKNTIMFHHKQLAYHLWETTKKTVEALSKIADPSELFIHIQQASRLMGLPVEDLKRSVEHYKINGMHPIN